MLDGTHYFECGCGADEHTLRFTLDLDERDLHTSIFLNDYRRWYQRLWVAIKYTFGYKSKYGDWDCWILHEPDAERLRKMLDEFIGKPSTYFTQEERKKRILEKPIVPQPAAGRKDGTENQTS